MSDVHTKIDASHLKRDAYLYVRRSTARSGLSIFMLSIRLELLRPSLDETHAELVPETQKQNPQRMLRVLLTVTLSSSRS
jgi:hypothetical protein